jgi:hypothetical protein
MEALVTQILNYFSWIKIFTNDNGSCPTKTHLYKNSSKFTDVALWDDGRSLSQWKSIRL